MTDFRSIDQFTGTVAARPSKFWQAMSETNNLAAELDELHELRTRNAELEESLKLARADADDAAETIGALLVERDRLADELVCARKALTVCITRALAKTGTAS